MVWLIFLVILFSYWWNDIIIWDSFIGCVFINNSKGEVGLDKNGNDCKMYWKEDKV